MELHQIEVCLDSSDPQMRMKAIAHLKNHTPDVVVPLLKRRMYDQEFMIRSFVAMGLGFQRSEEGFQLLVQMIETDRDPNVRAQAANSLSKFGDLAIPHLMTLFKRDVHWLVRQSILAAMEGLEHPDSLLQLCLWGLESDNLQVKLAAIANLGALSVTSMAETALTVLLSLAVDRDAEVRAQVARVLRGFDAPQAQAALFELRQDGDYRVVAATLEGLL
jgi:HEAT repeat protein